MTQTSDQLGMFDVPDKTIKHKPLRGQEGIKTWMAKCLRSGMTFDQMADLVKPNAQRLALMALDADLISITRYEREVGRTPRVRSG